MEHVAVRSRDLAIVGYDEKSQTLEVAFRSGGVYQYKKVPKAIYGALMKAPSLGIYFNDNIKDKFTSSKIKRN